MLTPPFEPTLRPAPRARRHHLSAAAGWVLGLALLGGCGKANEPAPPPAPAPAVTAAPPPAPVMAPASTFPAPSAPAAPAAPASLAPSAASEPGSNAALPADVLAFRAKRDQCDQLRGEDPGDRKGKAREELLAKLTQYCAGSDAALQALRLKYTNNLAVLGSLKDYDDKIE